LSAAQSILHCMRSYCSNRLVRKAIKTSACVQLSAISGSEFVRQLEVRARRCAFLCVVDWELDFAVVFAPALLLLPAASGEAFAERALREACLPLDLDVPGDEVPSSAVATEARWRLLEWARAICAGSAMRSRRPDPTLMPLRLFQLRSCASETPKRSAMETSVSPRCVV